VSDGDDDREIMLRRFNELAQWTNDGSRAISRRVTSDSFNELKSLMEIIGKRSLDPPFCSIIDRGTKLRNHLPWVLHFFNSFHKKIFFGFLFAPRHFLCAAENIFSSDEQTSTIHGNMTEAQHMALKSDSVQTRTNF
jgi:hypothetical protein